MPSSLLRLAGPSPCVEKHPLASSSSLERRQRLDRLWLRFVEDGVEPQGLAPEIVRSWLRAREEFGIDPTLRRSQRWLEPEVLMERRRLDAAHRLALPVLEGFAQRLGLAEQVLAYFDASGFMLSIHGPQDAIDKVAEIGFAPGASWSEASTGTSGPGTALREGKPLEVFASEHFVEAWQRWTCAGAPIFAPGESEPVALVDITGPWHTQSPQVLPFAQAIARAIEERVRAARGVVEEVIRHALRAQRDAGDILLAADASGRILAGNSPATGIIGLEAGRLPADLRRALSAALLAGTRPRDEVPLEFRDVRLVASAVLHEGTPVGAILRGPRRSPAGRSSTRGPARGPARYELSQILGQSSVIRRAVDQARMVARNALPVVLWGESGTGKELFAQAIHGSSSRSGSPFVAINCGSIPESLVEAELLGYEPGTFTGGRREGSAGKFEQADGGTLFLDEVSELSPQGQTALLRVLQEREVVRLGGGRPRPVDVRIVAATNRDLKEQITAGRFREDLFYRLDVLSIRIPPLRQRVEDVPLLAQAFIEEAEALVGRAALSLADDAIAALQACPWPGNVRQLRNVVLRAAATAPERLIHASDFPAEVRASADSAMESPAERARAERRELETVLAETQWNIARAAARLGIARMTLYRRLQRLGLARPAEGAAGHADQKKPSALGE